jgi:hypothetical protein
VTFYNFFDKTRRYVMCIPSCIRKRNREKRCTRANSEITIIIIWFPSDQSYRSRYIDKQFTTFFFDFTASLFGHVLAQFLTSDYTAFNNHCSLVAPFCVFCPNLQKWTKYPLKILAASQNPFNNTHHLNYLFNGAIVRGPANVTSTLCFTSAETTIETFI